MIWFLLGLAVGGPVWIVTWNLLAVLKNRIDLARAQRAWNKANP